MLYYDYVTDSKGLAQKSNIDISSFDIPSKSITCNSDDLEASDKAKIAVLTDGSSSLVCKIQSVDKTNGTLVRRSSNT